MQGPRNQADFDRLFSLSKATAYSDLAREAERLATAQGCTLLECGVAYAFWGYSLLRLDPHKHQQKAADLTTQAETLLLDATGEDPYLIGSALLTVGLSWQLLGDHDRAGPAFAGILSQPGADLALKVKAGFSRAFSLYAAARHDEALCTYQELAQQLDSLPADLLTAGLRRDRQRIRLNVADHYLKMGQNEAADAELKHVEGAALTPLMDASRLVSQARIAMMRDQWREAETFANRAYTAALEVKYNPLRIDALGVLVAVAARRNRRDEQLRLVVEMASLAQAK